MRNHRPLKKQIIGEYELYGNVSVVRDHVHIYIYIDTPILTKLPPHYNLQCFCPNKKALSCLGNSCSLCFHSSYFESIHFFNIFVFMHVTVCFVCFCTFTITIQMGMSILFESQLV